MNETLRITFALLGIVIPLLAPILLENKYRQQRANLNAQDLLERVDEHRKKAADIALKLKQNEFSDGKKSALVRDAEEHWIISQRLSMDLRSAYSTSRIGATLYVIFMGASLITIAYLTIEKFRQIVIFILESHNVETKVVLVTIAILLALAVITSFYITPISFSSIVRRNISEYIGENPRNSYLKRSGDFGKPSPLERVLILRNSDLKRGMFSLMKKRGPDLAIVIALTSYIIIILVVALT